MRNILNFKHYKLRDFSKMNSINDGSRTLNESIMVPEVIDALNDWKSNHINNCILIGGVALSYYIKPRYTSDVDVLFLSFVDIPEKVYKFKRHREHAFQHIKHHVEVEVVTPELINTPLHIVEAIFKTANDIDGIKVASPSGLVATKLGRFNHQDQADIVALINYTKIDLTPFGLPENLIEKFEILKNSIV
jgi:hypothetical protein